MWALSAYTGPTSGRFRSVPARSPTDTVTMAYDCSGDPSLVAPSHVNGYFQTLYGTTNRLKSYYFADGGISPSSQYDLLFTGIVKPVDASLLSATGGNPLSVSASIASPVNMCELMAVGDTSTAANVSVWVWQGGRILMATGAAYNASTVPLVGAREVVIGLQLHPTLGPRLYVNGALKTSSFAGWKNISDNSSLASPPLIAMNATQAKRGLFLGSRTVYTSGTAFNVAYKSWRVVNTSGMTDAQVENTQLYRIFFRAVAAREIGSSADNGAPSGTIKVLRDGTNTVLQAVNPNGSQGGSIVISSQPSTRSKDGNISSTSIVGVSLEGFQTEPLPAEDPRLAGIADNTTPAPDKHSLIRATTHDLVLAGNNVLPVADPGGRHGRVVTLGELHAYKGDGTAAEGGDAIRVWGKHLNAASGLQDPAWLTVGVHQNAQYAQTGSSATRARVASTPNADLSLESGDQLRLSGRAVVAHSQSSFKFLPGGPLPPPDAWLEIARKDDPAGIALSTSASLDMVVKPGTGRFGVEADSVELGAGDVRYKFVVVNGQLRINKRVVSAQSEKTPQPKMRASGIRQRAMTTANREVNNLTVGDTITFGNGDRLGATNPFAFGSFGHFASTYDDAGEPVLEYRVANPAAPGGYDMFFRVSRDQSPAAVVRVWTPVCQEKTGKSNPVVLVDTVKKRLLSVGVGAKEHVMAFADRGDAKRFAIAARPQGVVARDDEEPIHLVTGLRCIDVPPDLLMKYCSYSSMAVYFASERPERDVIISEGVFRVHPRGSGYPSFSRPGPRASKMAVAAFSGLPPFSTIARRVDPPGLPVIRLVDRGAGRASPRRAAEDTDRIPQDRLLRPERRVQRLAPAQRHSAPHVGQPPRALHPAPPGGVPLLGRRREPDVAVKKTLTMMYTMPKRKASAPSASTSSRSWGDASIDSGVEWTPSLDDERKALRAEEEKRKKRDKGKAATGPSRATRRGVSAASSRSSGRSASHEYGTYSLGANGSGAGPRTKASARKPSRAADKGPSRATSASSRSSGRSAPPPRRKQVISVSSGLSGRSAVGAGEPEVMSRSKQIDPPADAYRLLTDYMSIQDALSLSGVNKTARKAVLDSLLRDDRVWAGANQATMELQDHKRRRDMASKVEEGVRDRLERLREGGMEESNPAIELLEKIRERAGRKGALARLDTRDASEVDRRYMVEAPRQQRNLQRALQRIGGGESLRPLAPDSEEELNREAQRTIDFLEQSADWDRPDVEDLLTTDYWSRCSELHGRRNEALKWCPRLPPQDPRNTQVTAENDLHNLLGPLLALLQLAHLPPQGRRHPTLRGLALIADADGEWAVNLAREPAITITHDDGRNVYRDEYALNGVAHLSTARDWANDQLRYILNPLTGRVDRDRRALTIQNLRAERAVQEWSSQSGSPPPEDSGEGGDYVPGTEQGEREVWTGKKGRKRARKTSGETAPGTSRSHAAKRSRSESPLPPQASKRVTRQTTRAEEERERARRRALQLQKYKEERERRNRS
eukprot:jgi/Mesvir1/9036/Mv21319-RA.1